MADIDLFGREVIHPIKGEQLPLFHEPTPVKIPGETEADRRIARKFTDTPTAPMFPPATTTNTAAAPPPSSSDNSPPKRRPLARKPTLPERVEADIKSRGIPYVSVDEAKRALFASKTIDRCFHFVVYSHAGDNWLLLCGEAGEANRRAMTDWEQIFGDGFKAVFAVERAAGIVFKTLAGEKLKLDECAGRKGSENGSQ